jgi:diguanylate cyclase (GGDEF)-like protein
VKHLPKPRLSLLAKFGVMSVIPVVLSTLILGPGLGRLVREQNLSVIKQQAVLLADLRIQPSLAQIGVSSPLSARDQQVFDDLVNSKALDGYVAGLRIWNHDGRLIYSDDHSQIGTQQPVTGLLATAFAGEAAADPRFAGTGDTSAAPGPNVFVPLDVQSGHPAAVAQLFLPADAISKLVKLDTKKLYLLLLVGFTLFYAALFRIVATASRRLQRQASENEYLALHDSLTGLPNRALFLERANQALLSAKRSGWNFAVMIMDLDRFKEINDTLGHHHGDMVLRQIGQRLEPLLRESDTVARLGGDEFAILLPHVADPADAPGIASKVRKALEAPFHLQGLALEVDASIGIAIFPKHGKDVHTLVQRADVAMYQAKTAGTGHQTYAAEQDQYTPDRLVLGGELRHAIERGELILHYQPQMALEDDRVRGMEALIRWNHPNRGIILPGEFIPIAERGGLIQPLTRYVLNEALRQVHVWDSQGLRMGVAVNLSVRNLLDSNFPREVQQLLHKWSVNPVRVELEITESSIMADPEKASEILVRLHNLGVRLAVDDFGTGYSSLSALKRLPINAIKIDKSFVLNMANDENDLFIVRSVIDLAHNLGAEVVAEGVESEEVVGMLRGLGCDFIQGYHCGKPTAVEEVRWLLGEIDPIAVSPASALTSGSVPTRMPSHLVGAPPPPPQRVRH